GDVQDLHPIPTSIILSAFRAFWRRLAGNKASVPAGALDFTALVCGGKGIANQERDAGNDRGIRQVKDIPRERPDMKMIEIGDKPIGQTVIGIAKRAADNKTKAQGGGFCPCAP